jgi:hypothetical protein
MIDGILDFGITAVGTGRVNAKRPRRSRLAERREQNTASEQRHDTSSPTHEILLSLVKTADRKAEKSMHSERSEFHDSLT